MSRGMTATFFNWIFIIIAGALIIMFFFKIIHAQAKLTETEISTRVLKDLEDIIIGKSTTSETASEIKIQNREFIIECAEPCTERTGCKSSISTPNSMPIEMSGQPIFSLQKIKADTIYAFTLSWNIPFHAGNFLYLASPGEKIIFDSATCGAGTDCDRIFAKIPQRIKNARIAVQTANPQAEQGDFVRKVKFGNCPYEENTICVDGNKINFYESSTKSFNYYGDETVLGAIFSQDSKTFECNMKKAVYKMKNIQAVLEGKRAQFSTYYQNEQPNQNCQSVYNEIQAPLDTYKINSYGDLNGGTISANSEELSTINNAMRRYSCSSLY
jgi:hypothetical protein